MSIFQSYTLFGLRKYDIGRGHLLQSNSRSRFKYYYRFLYRGGPDSLKVCTLTSELYNLFNTSNVSFITTCTTQNIYNMFLLSGVWPVGIFSAAKADLGKDCTCWFTFTFPVVMAGRWNFASAGDSSPTLLKRHCDIFKVHQPFLAHGK